MNYSVSELGGFAGQTLAEQTGRADVGRQKIKEEKEKAEKQSGTQNSSSSGEGFVNALWMGFRKIKDDVEKLWNGLTGEGFNTNEELKQMEEGKKQAIAAALNEWDKMKTEDMSQDILSNFNTDSKEVTDAKIQAMRDAKLDTTQIEKQVAIRRQQDAEYKAQIKAEQLANQSAGKETYGYAHATPNDVENGKLDQKIKKYFPGGTCPYYVTGDHDQELYREMFKNGDFKALDSMENSYKESIRLGRPKGINVEITKETEDYIIEQHNQDRIAAFGSSGMDEDGNLKPGWMPGLIKDKEALIRSNPGEGNPERFKHWHIVKNEGKETWDFHHDPYDATDGYSGLLGHALSDNLKVFIEKKVKKIIKK